jgi:hypothetical protein
MAVPDVIATPNLPTLSPFPDFRFGAPISIETPDLGIHPRASPRPLNPTKIELKATAELQQLRDEMARQARSIPDRLKDITREEPLRIANVQFQTPQVQPTQEIPQIPTTTEFLYP